MRYWRRFASLNRAYAAVVAPLWRLLFHEIHPTQTPTHFYAWACVTWCKVAFSVRPASVDGQPTSTTIGARLDALYEAQVLYHERMANFKKTQAAFLALHADILAAAPAAQEEAEEADVCI